MKVLFVKKEIMMREKVVKFRYVEDKTHGFVFPCDTKGNVLLASKSARNNFQKCLNLVDTGEMLFDGYRSEVKEISMPTQGICEYCGHLVTVKGLVGRCPCCGVLYDEYGREV